MSTASHDPRPPDRVERSWQRAAPSAPPSVPPPSVPPPSVPPPLPPSVLLPRVPRQHVPEPAPADDDVLRQRRRRARHASGGTVGWRLPFGRRSRRPR